MYISLRAVDIDWLDHVISVTLGWEANAGYFFLSESASQQ